MGGVRHDGPSFSVNEIEMSEWIQIFILFVQDELTREPTLSS